MRIRLLRKERRDQEPQEGSSPGRSTGCHQLCLCSCVLQREEQKTKPNEVISEI